MAERKWGAISSGATFEALATTLVFFEDPKAALFGRRGKDGGQDARSGDGKRVFQAKFHADGDTASAIRDAKKEAEKLARYRTPGHARYEQWKGVTHWRLVTNVAFNPTDRETWDREVVPLFTAQSLTPDYWEKQNLDGLLDKHPEIHRSFFENETRAFLSVGEVRDRWPFQEPFLQRAALGSFFGRDGEVGQIQTFLSSSNLFLVVHGAGGMGKTRLLLEAGETIAADGDWQVLWANVASMAATGTWFDAIVPERPTLLLVDEPPDEALLQQLAEQIGGRLGRTAKWRVAVAVRSPKDPVLRFLFGPRLRPQVQELQIGVLSDSAAQEMCSDLLLGGKLGTLPEETRRDAAQELARRFSRHPIWLTLAVHVLESRGDLSLVPTTAKDLADSYLEEIVDTQRDSPPERVRDLLRWVALLGTVNRMEDATIKLIADTTGAGGLPDVRKQLANLVSRRALAERGAKNRFVELKPDVLRDHVLLSWLTVDVGYGDHPVIPSDDATALVTTVCNAVLAGSLGPLGRAVLESLARTEFLLGLSGCDVPICRQFFESVRRAVDDMTASHRVALAEALESIAHFHPVATAESIRTLRLSSAPDETVAGLFRPHVVGQDDVVLSLGWPLFLAAMGAQTPSAQDVVLSELCALAEAEAELATRLPRGLPNDGKRAAALVERVVEGGPQFWGDFDHAAQKLGDALLTRISTLPPTNGSLTLLKALIQPAVAVERRQTWSDDRVLHMQTFAITPHHPAWATRAALLERVKELLSDIATPPASRIALWRVFSEAHRSINQACRRGPTKHQPYYDLLLSDLTWAKGLLERRLPPVEELSAARDLWDWHYRFEQDPELKAASVELEHLYAANDLAKEFEPLLAFEEWEERDARSAAKGDELAASSDPKDIIAFLDRAVAFVGLPQELSRLADVAWSLGRHARDREVVRAFVKTLLSEPRPSPRSEFAATAATAWVAAVRTGPTPEATHLLVKELVDSSGGDQQKVQLLLRIYGRVPRSPHIGEMTPGEHAFFRAQKSLFVANTDRAEFIAALALSLEHDWPSLKLLLEDLIQSVSQGDRPAALRALITGLYWAAHERDPATLPAGLAEWLLNQLLLIPDFDDLGGLVEWHLEEILKQVGRVPVTWLPGALATRIAFEAAEPRGPDVRVRALSYHARFSKYVRRLGADDVGDPTIEPAIPALLDFLSDNGSVGYHLPEVLQDADPDGLLIPAAVAQRIQVADVPEKVRRLARIGGAYSLGSRAWRTIAKAAISAVPATVDARRSIFTALGARGVRTWSGKPGEVSTVFTSAVEIARTALHSEVDEILKPFWQWHLERAEAELAEQEEQAKEERGE